MKWIIYIYLINHAADMPKSVVKLQDTWGEILYILSWIREDIINFEKAEEFIEGEKELITIFPPHG